MFLPNDLFEPARGNQPHLGTGHVFLQSQLYISCVMQE